jgi:hypothetical protein
MAGRRPGMNGPDGISFFDSTGLRLICRPFDMEEYRLNPAVLVPGRGRSCRRGLNFSMQEVRRIRAATWKG